jgi:deoxyribodipyrimidine photolyase
MDVPVEKILKWETDWDEEIYPKPIVNHDERREIMLKRYKDA